MSKVIVTGANGQIGSELMLELREKYGKDEVLGVDLREPLDFLADGPFESFDATDKVKMDRLITEHEPKEVYHLVGILSATGEKNPQLAWKVNMGSLKNILDIAKDKKFKMFWPSSIAAFGPTTPRDNTPQKTILEPNTMYGVTKVSGELLCNYYNQKYGVDVRSLRFPGLLSWKTPPGGGTTDYATAILYDGLKEKKYSCFVKEDTVLPMMYMPDAIRSIIELMAAEKDKITVRTSYNLAAISFSAKEMAEYCKKVIDGLEVDFSPDYRQDIADSWPKTIDDSKAREDWGWSHEWTMEKMYDDMLDNLKKKQI